MEKLPINSNDGFLHLQDLPHNCIFNKVVTGCGGTTVVLTNKENYVIAVPTTELIVNKCKNDNPGLSPINNIFGLFGPFTYRLKKDFADYIKSPGIKKIMCTYDKLEKIAEYLNPSDYRLLVDEYHSLLKAYSYRDEAINGVLKSFNDYKSFCFMSATPIAAEFKPSILEGVKEIIAEWNDMDIVTVKLEQTNKPYVMAANIINSYKKDGYITVDGIKSYEAFFFVNSVTDIKAIIDYCKLSNDEIRIICSDNQRNMNKLEGFGISNSNSQNKMFTFLTSKSFEGVDYFSETGICYVVSSSTNPNTLASIDTDIPQIAGRIRTKTNPFRNKIIHIYNTRTKNLSLDVPYEEMVERTITAIKDTIDTVEMFNNSPLNVKNKLRKNLKDRLNDMYMSYNDDDDKFIVNDILPKLELYNYKVNQVIYSSGIALSKSYNDNNIATTKINWETLNENIDKKITDKLSFKDAFIRYAEIYDNMIYSFETDHILSIQPLVETAYHKLGTDKVRSLRYIKSSVKDALTALNDNKNTDSKIAVILSRKISKGFISNKDIKVIIQNAYDVVGIKEAAKATDILKWFDCELVNKRIDEKLTNGYNVYRCRTIFK